MVGEEGVGLEGEEGGISKEGGSASSGDERHIDAAIALLRALHITRRHSLKSLTNCERETFISWANREARSHDAFILFSELSVLL